MIMNFQMNNDNSLCECTGVAVENGNYMNWPTGLDTSLEIFHTL